MATEELRARYWQFIAEIFNQPDLSSADQYVAIDALDHAGLPGQPSGREGWKMKTVMLFTGFPDVAITVEDQITSGDQVVTRWTLPPTGRQIAISGIDIVRFKGGKMVEHWAQMDALGMMQQLGVIPAPEPASARD